MSSFADKEKAVKDGSAPSDIVNVGEVKEDTSGKDGERNGSSSESEDDDDGGRKEDQLEEDEAEALKADLGDDLRHGKRIRKEHDQSQNTLGDHIDSAKDVPSTASDEVWKAMQSEGAQKPASGTDDAEKEALVRITHTYRFAGEEVQQEKLLPASHPDVKAFLAKQGKQSSQRFIADKANEQSSSQPTSLSAVSSTTSAPQKPASGPASGPRKRKAGSLAAMSAAASAAGKPQKLNTLEKSKMDWTKFKDTTLGEQARHELDAQTRGGASGSGSMKGYMERRDFLDRVQDRLDGGGQ